MHFDVNKKSDYSNFKGVLILIVGLIVLTSILNQAQDKIKDQKHDGKMKMEKMDKTHCEEEGMSCCGGEKMKASESSVTPWNEVCPVRGEKINKEVETVSYNGKAYGFCCAGCDKKFTKDPAKYSGNLSEDGKKFNKKS